MLPALVEGVRRPRLDAMLDRGLDHTLTLVSAGPGFGKTLTVASWVRRRQVDHGRSDRQGGTGCGVDDGGDEVSHPQAEGSREQSTHSRSRPRHWATLRVKPILSGRSS